MRDDGFDDEEPTDPTGALPELEEDSDDTTTRTAARCSRCLRILKVAGNTRPTFEAMEENAPETCWRSMDGRWFWCSGRRPLTLTLTG